MIAIKDKKVVIVGASSGIGEAIAKLCVENEAEVHLISLSEQKLVSV